MLYLSVCVYVYLLCLFVAHTFVHYGVNYMLLIRINLRNNLFCRTDYATFDICYVVKWSRKTLYLPHITGNLFVLYN